MSSGNPLATLTSRCCEAPVTVGGKDDWDSDEGGTRFYVCVACDKPCEALREDESLCPDCDGEGYTLPLVADRNGILSHVRRGCRRCQGTGRLRA